MKINWPKIASDVTASLTMLAMIPYDKDSMDLINHAVPSTWIPWVIKTGIAATLILRISGRYLTPPMTTETKP